MKKKTTLILVLILILSALKFSYALVPGTNSTLLLYNQMHLNNIVNYDLFKIALKGYNRIADKNKQILTIIDFTKPSSEERFYVLDLDSKKLLYKTYVAHGRNSGENYAKQFSNLPGSYQSSLGFYLTSDTYMGNNGYSLRLEGLEDGINDNAMKRAIVVHGAAYANPDIIAAQGRLGRSLGCPALPANLSKEIIDIIKEGSLLFIYADSPEYRTQSTLLS